MPSIHKFTAKIKGQEQFSSMKKYQGIVFVTQNLEASYQSTISCVYQIQQSADSGRIATLTALHLPQPSLPRLISKQSLIEEMPWSIV